MSLQLQLQGKLWFLVKIPFIFYCGNGSFSTGKSQKFSRKPLWWSCTKGVLRHVIIRGICKYFQRIYSLEHMLGFTFTAQSTNLSNCYFKLTVKTMHTILMNPWRKEILLNQRMVFMSLSWKKQVTWN